MAIAVNGTLVSGSINGPFSSGVGTSYTQPTLAGNDVLFVYWTFTLLTSTLNSPVVKWGTTNLTNVVSQVAGPGGSVIYMGFAGLAAPTVGTQTVSFNWASSAFSTSAVIMYYIFSVSGCIQGVGSSGSAFCDYLSAGHTPVQTSNSSNPANLTVSNSGAVPVVLCSQTNSNTASIGPNTFYDITSSVGLNGPGLVATVNNQWYMGMGSEGAGGTTFSGVGTGSRDTEYNNGWVSGTVYNNAAYLALQPALAGGVGRALSTETRFEPRIFNIPLALIGPSHSTYPINTPISYPGPTFTPHIVKETELPFFHVDNIPLSYTAPPPGTRAEPHKGAIHIPPSLLCAPFSWIPQPPPGPHLGSVDRRVMKYQFGRRPK